jgi:hypothetical protein
LGGFESHTTSKGNAFAAKFAGDTFVDQYSVEADGEEKQRGDQNCWA